MGVRDVEQVLEPVDGFDGLVRLGDLVELVDRDEHWRKVAVVLQLEKEVAKISDPLRMAAFALVEPDLILAVDGECRQQLERALVFCLQTCLPAQRPQLVGRELDQWRVGSHADAREPREECAEIRYDHEVEPDGDKGDSGGAERTLPYP